MSLAQPLVSVVTPSFNQARFLERTILSVLGQDYPRLEYIVVDGGSTDGSRAIIEKYASRVAWWVSEPDAGQTDATKQRFLPCAWRHPGMAEFRRYVAARRSRLSGEGPRVSTPTAGLVYGAANYISAG